MIEPPYDETFEEFEKRTGLDNYFTDFSNEVRGRLLTKNLTKPKDVYDILYPNTKEENLAKNISISTDLTKESLEIRNRVLAKNISEQIDLEKSGELYRKQQESKNKLVKTSKELEDFAEQSRKESIAKNNLVKNNLESISKLFKDNNIKFNIFKESNLEAESEIYRNKELSKNLIKDSYLLENEKENKNSLYLKDNLSKNNLNNSDLNVVSQSYRQQSLSKNQSKKTDLLESSIDEKLNQLSKNKDFELDILSTESVQYKVDNLSKNISNKSDLEKDSINYRNDDLAKNVDIDSDLDTSSLSNRIDDLSKNTKINSDLEQDSVSYRSDDLSNNLSINTDLEQDSVPYRNDDLSNNLSINTDLESDSIVYRNDDLSNNLSINTDLESDSIVYRNDDLSNNLSINTDLEQDSVPYRNDDLSNNLDINTDLEQDSVPYSNDDLSNNLDINTDLEQDSVPYRNDDLSKNVDINSDLEQDSVPYRNDDLSKNVDINSDLQTDSVSSRLDDLAKNIDIDSNLEVDSISYRSDDLSKNIDIDSDLEVDSILYRNDDLSKNSSTNLNLGDIAEQELSNQVSSNVANETDLSQLSNIFRNEQLSKNGSRFTLGTNLTIGGTSTFIGISNLEIQGAIFRKANQILNRRDGLKSVFDDEESLQFFREKSTEGGLSTGRENLISKNNIKNLPKIEGKGNIYDIYGVSDKYTDDIGYITNLMSLHNIQQNTFQASNRFEFQNGSQNATDELLNFTSKGFQELISTVGISKNLQQRTNTTPREIISQNNGKYLSEDTSKILKSIDGELGSGVSMASQTETSDIITKDFEKYGKRSRGVRHIIDTIKSSSNVSFAQNFNSQGEQGQASVFILGRNDDGTLKKSYNRYSIKNPYAPEGAENLKFSLTNYSMDKQNNTLILPAYIKSFQHGDNATMNSVNFLGRPEPIYTYSNSSRDGSVTFFVLTDYASEVDMGYSFNPNNGEVSKVVEDFDEINFSLNTSTLESEIKSIESQIKQQKTALQEDNITSSERQQINAELRQLGISLSVKSSQLNKVSNEQNRYSEKNYLGDNIYKFSSSFQESLKEEDYIDSKPENTVEKLSQMKKNLMFQPAYFSGSKVDFLERMEFISKLTRPSRNKVSGSNGGFSFSKAPISHLVLGDWFNHDIVVNSVSYDYSDAPWTLDGGRQQPMWCSVTINFNIIGTYGSNGGEDVPLSTDKGGYFSRRRSI
jgi:hypothetical protein